MLALYYLRPMSAVNVGQLAILLGQACFVYVLLLVLFHLRTHFGLSLLFITLGAFQLMQSSLAHSFYVVLMPGVLVSPGSIVLFTSSLFALLLVYIREDASEARKLIYGLVIANLALEASFLLVSRQMNSPGVLNMFNLPHDLFERNPRVVWFGTAALFLDGAILIILYEWVSRHVRRSLFLRIYFSMVLVLLLDTLVFATGSFWGQPLFASLLLSGLAGKTVISVLYAAILTGYLRLFEKSGYALSRGEAGIQDLFEFFTYRQKYEVLQQRVVRDALTGLYNRSFFDDVLPGEVQRTYHLGHSLALLIIDVDNFKQYNDTYGHPEGDEVLKFVSATLVENLRSSDLACRYGGDEFALILPDCDPRFAALTSERIRTRLADGWERHKPPLRGDRITLTIGIALLPEEAPSAAELVRMADERLLQGKRAGRDHIISR